MLTTYFCFFFRGLLLANSTYSIHINAMTTTKMIPQYKCHKYCSTTVVFGAWIAQGSFWRQRLFLTLPPTYCENFLPRGALDPPGPSLGAPFALRDLHSKTRVCNVHVLILGNGGQNCCTKSIQDPLMADTFKMYHRPSLRFHAFDCGHRIHAPIH